MDEQRATASDEARTHILKVFGITEEEMAALDEMDGYAVARLAAAEDRVAFLARLDRLRADIEADLTREFL